MSTAYFDVECLDAPPLEDCNGFPSPQPKYATLSFLGPHGIRVLGGSENRKYLQECAVALARACRGRVTSSTGKLISDESRNDRVPTREQLLADWAEALRGLQQRRVAPLRQWEREHRDNPEVQEANDWSDV